MRFLRMSVDKFDNITLSVYESDGKVYMSKSQGVQHSRILKQYDNAREALRAFDRQIMDDYREQGIFYDDFYGSD